MPEQRTLSFSLNFGPLPDTVKEAYAFDPNLVKLTLSLGVRPRDSPRLLLRCALSNFGCIRLVGGLVAHFPADRDRLFALRKVLSASMVNGHVSVTPVPFPQRPTSPTFVCSASGGAAEVASACGGRRSGSED